ncbi:NAD--arginine ADP-ribosyltransferase [Amycolatopsis keratiniphila]|uniref:NAD:arginine ADP-ribosyltransferase with a RelA/SpoT domain n=1 Tax=Amycolatopsis keratiniphila TaxID=129921 RepID=R4T1M6_9PSEU|nr:NAD--arginine ADP-ribosyltransferase [Amycolatopsis keratiniphila]AGM08740.1 NAD:arginine ADP-ribosyltransferase with a RelA/SpoT domain [Amycolatopsis keratiniphila]
MSGDGDIREPEGDLWNAVLTDGGYAKDSLWPPDSELAAREMEKAWKDGAAALRTAVDSSNLVAQGLRTHWPDPNGYALYDGITRVNNGDLQGQGGVKEVPPAMEGLGNAYGGYAKILEFVKTQIRETISYHSFIYSHLDDGGSILNPGGEAAQRFFARAIAKNIAELVTAAAALITDPDSAPAATPKIANPGFVGGIYDGLVSLAKMMGGLIGYADGPFGGSSWSLSNAVLAWGGMAKLGAAVQAYTHGLGWVDLAVGLPGGKRGELGGVLLDFGKHFIHYGEWDEDPGHALGGTLVNVAALVGLRGAGSATRAAGAGISRAGAAASRVSGLAAVGKVVSGAGARLSRGGEALVKVPTVTELAIRNAPHVIEKVQSVVRGDRGISAETAAQVIRNPLGPLPGSVGESLARHGGPSPDVPAARPHDTGGNGTHDTGRNGPRDPDTGVDGPGGRPPHPPDLPSTPPKQSLAAEPPQAGQPIRNVDLTEAPGPGGRPDHHPSAGPGDKPPPPPRQESPVKAGQPPTNMFDTVGMHELANGKLGEAGRAGAAEAHASGRWKGDPTPEVPRGVEPSTPNTGKADNPSGPPSDSAVAHPVHRERPPASTERPGDQGKQGQPPAKSLTPRGGDNGRTVPQHSSHEGSRPAGEHADGDGPRHGDDGPPVNPRDVLRLDDLARGKLGEAGHVGIEEARASGQWKGDGEPGPRRPGDSPEEGTPGALDRTPDEPPPSGPGDSGRARPDDGSGLAPEPGGGGVATAVRPDPVIPTLQRAVEPSTAGVRAEAPAARAEHPPPVHSTRSSPSPSTARLAEQVTIGDVISGAPKPLPHPEAEPLTVKPDPDKVRSGEVGGLPRVTDPKPPSIGQPVRPLTGVPPRLDVGFPPAPVVGFPPPATVDFPRPPGEVRNPPGRTTVPAAPVGPDRPVYPEPSRVPEWPLELPAVPDRVADPVAPLTPGGPDRPPVEIVPPSDPPDVTVRPVDPAPIELPLLPDEAVPVLPSADPPWPGAPVTSPLPRPSSVPERAVPEWPVEIPSRHQPIAPDLPLGPREDQPSAIPPEIREVLTETERDLLDALAAAGVNIAFILERVLTELTGKPGVPGRTGLPDRLASLTDAQRAAFRERLEGILGAQPVRPRPATEGKPEPEYQILGSPEGLWFPYTISLNSDTITAYGKAVREHEELLEQLMWAGGFLPPEEVEKLLETIGDLPRLKELLRDLRDSVQAALVAAWELVAQGPRGMEIDGVREPVYSAEGELLGTIDAKARLADGTEVWVTAGRLAGPGEKDAANLLGSAAKSISPSSGAVKRYFVLSTPASIGSPATIERIAGNLRELGFDAVLHHGRERRVADELPLLDPLFARDARPRHPQRQEPHPARPAAPTRPADLPEALVPLWESLSVREQRALANLATAGSNVGRYAMTNFVTWLAQEKGFSREVSASLAEWLARVPPPDILPPKFVPAWHKMPADVQQAFAKLIEARGLQVALSEFNGRIGELTSVRGTPLQRVEDLDAARFDILRRLFTEQVTPTSPAEMGRTLFFHGVRPILDRWLVLHQLIDRLGRHGVTNVDELYEDLHRRLKLTFQKLTGLDPAGKIDAKAVGGSPENFRGFEATLRSALRLADLRHTDPEKLVRLGLPGLKIIALDRKIYRPNGEELSDIDILGELADGTRVWIEVKHSKLEYGSARYETDLAEKIRKQRGHEDYQAGQTKIFVLFATKVDVDYAKLVMTHGAHAVLHLDPLQNVELVARREMARLPVRWNQGRQEQLFATGSADTELPPPFGPLGGKRQKPPQRQWPHPERPPSSAKAVTTPAVRPPEPSLPSRPAQVPAKVWKQLSTDGQAGMAKAAASGHPDIVRLLGAHAAELAGATEHPRPRRIPKLLASLTPEQHRDLASALDRAATETAKARPARPAPPLGGWAAIEIGGAALAGPRRPELKGELARAFSQAVEDAGLAVLAEYVRSSIVAGDGDQRFTVVAEIGDWLGDRAALWSVSARGPAGDPVRNVLRIAVSARLAPGAVPRVLAHALAAGAADLAGGGAAIPAYLDPAGDLDRRPELSPTDRGHLAQVVVLDREFQRAALNPPARARARKAIVELLGRLGLDPNQSGSDYRIAALAGEPGRWEVRRHLPPKVTDGYLATKTHVATGLYTSVLPSGISAGVFMMMGSGGGGVAWAVFGLVNALIGAGMARKWEIAKDEQVAKGRVYDATARRIDAGAASAEQVRGQLAQLGVPAHHGPSAPSARQAGLARLGPRPDLAQGLGKHFRRFALPPLTGAAVGIGVGIPLGLTGAPVLSIIALAGVAALLQPFAERRRTQIQKGEELRKIDDNARELDHLLATYDVQVYVDLAKRLGLDPGPKPKSLSLAHREPKPLGLGKAANAPDILPYFSEIVRRTFRGTAAGTLDQSAFLARHLTLFESMFAYGAGRSIATLFIAVWQLNKLDQSELEYTVARRTFDERQLRYLASPQVAKEREEFLKVAEAAVGPRPGFWGRLRDAAIRFGSPKSPPEAESRSVSTSDEPATRPGFASKAEFMKAYTRVSAVGAAATVGAVELSGASPALAVAAVAVAAAGPVIGWRKWWHRKAELEASDKNIAATNQQKADKRAAEQVETERFVTAQVTMSAEAVAAEARRADRPAVLGMAPKAFDAMRKVAEFMAARPPEKPPAPLRYLKPLEIAEYLWPNLDWAAPYEAALLEARRSIAAESVRLDTRKSWGDYETIGARRLAVAELARLADRVVTLLEHYRRSGNGEPVWVGNAELNNAIVSYQRLSSADWAKTTQEPAPDWPSDPGKTSAAAALPAPWSSPPILNTLDWPASTGWGTVPRGAGSWLPKWRNRTAASAASSQADFSNLAKATPLTSSPSIHDGSVRRADAERLIASEFPELPKTNPNAYSADAERDGYRTNCTRAVVAFVLRLRGEDVTAGPVRPEESETLAYISDRLGGQWETGHGRSYDSVIAAMNSRPIGAMAVIDIVHTGHDGLTDEHVALVVRRPYGIVFLDPQTGWLLKLPERPVALALLPFTDVPFESAAKGLSGLSSRRLAALGLPGLRIEKTVEIVAGLDLHGRLADGTEVRVFARGAVTPDFRPFDRGAVPPGGKVVYLNVGAVGGKPAEGFLEAGADLVLRYDGSSDFEVIADADPAPPGAPARYGPFHRLESTSQNAGVAGMQSASREIWGRAPVYGDHAPVVQAYRGPLPEGRRGVEFWTDIKPKWHGTNVAMRSWYPTQGVRVEDDFAKLEVVVTKNTQTEE